MTLLTLATSLITCCSIHIEPMSMNIGGWYQGGEIHLNANLPKDEWERTIYHEICHHDFRSFPSAKRKRIRERLDQHLYYEDYEEEYCERIARSLTAQ